MPDLERYNTFQYYNLICKQPRLSNCTYIVKTNVAIHVTNEYPEFPQTPQDFRFDQEPIGQLVAAERLITYDISPGDNLATIAYRYQTSQDEIRKRNPEVDFQRLQPGTRLKIYYPEIR